MVPSLGLEVRVYDSEIMNGGWSGIIEIYQPKEEGKSFTDGKQG